MRTLKPISQVVAIRDTYQAKCENNALAAVATLLFPLIPCLIIGAGLYMVVFLIAAVYFGYRANKAWNTVVAIDSLLPTHKQSKFL